MRWRNGDALCVDSVMALLLSGSEADCLVPQHKQIHCLSTPMTLARSPYRASGLVRSASAVVGAGRHGRPVGLGYQSPACERRRTAAFHLGEFTLSTRSRQCRFSGRLAGVPCNLPFRNLVRKSGFGESCHLPMSIRDVEKVCNRASRLQNCERTADGGRISRLRTHCNQQPKTTDIRIVVRTRLMVIAPPLIGWRCLTERASHT